MRGGGGRERTPAEMDGAKRSNFRIIQLVQHRYYTLPELDVLFIHQINNE